MALRLDTATFAQMAEEERARWARDAVWGARALEMVVAVDESPDAGPLAAVDAGVVVLHKKPILALVDTETGVREIVRNLLRWALEGASSDTGGPLA